ncbi:S8 family serine peptidase [Kineosporia sp. NBRC 101731]|uniref:cyanobactin maturation protease PatG family protein n=1 Tax=Kineosporia sp. NBRC 101731 TaxID=3032199 RepID=UPI0024A49C47|nr:S8 family serine peptidase [Kineosporia sp. NBRC 101731]GLY30753.1 hypothetical protein Kisp02_41180 [Kineosporia sp. NBRC 101731]
MPALAEIPGMRELWAATRGDAGIRIGVVEGRPDLGHPAFAGADLRVVEPVWLPAIPTDELLAEHGTFVASQIFGQGDEPVPGVAPGCRGIIVPALPNTATVADPLNLVHAVDALLDAGVHVIHFSPVLATSSGEAADLLRRSMAKAEEAGVLVVVPAGNNYGELQQIPAVIPTVLTVGAVDDEGRMFRFSNFGPGYRDHGIVAPGGNMLGATPGGGRRTEKGTSVSTPVVTGVAALLIGLQRRHGLAVDPLAVRDALIATARPLPAASCHGEPERGLSGLLDIRGALRRVLAGHEVLASMVDVVEPALDAVTLASVESVEVESVGVEPVFALGALGYDFGTVARKEVFAQRMAAVRTGRTLFPAQPDDVRQMVRHLRDNPTQSGSLIWTLSLESTPLYAVEVADAFAPEVYARLVDLLEGQFVRGAGQVERVAVAARSTGRWAQLISGQMVAVIELELPRHLNGWAAGPLAAEAVGQAGLVDQVGALTVPALRDFLHRICLDLRNRGATASERALNFAATSVFAAAEVFSQASALGLVLDRTTVEESPFGRADQVCRDVCLSFFDPENGRRAGRVFRLSVDVTDVQPVALGPVRSWARDLSSSERES